MKLHSLRTVAPGRAKTEFYLSGARQTTAPDFGKDMPYGKKFHYSIYLLRKGTPNPVESSKGANGAFRLKDVEINGERGAKLQEILSTYHYNHLLSMVKYSITKDGKIALEPNYYRLKKEANDLVGIDAKLMVLYDLKKTGVRCVQPYRDRQGIIWPIDYFIAEVEAGLAPRVFGRMPLADGLQ